MSPTPRRQSLVNCPACGTPNEASNTRCIGCQAPMSVAVQPFTFPDTGQQVRTARIGDEPWFAAADVCAALAIGNHSQATSYLDPDEKGVITDETPGGLQALSAVNEPGLYSLILRSRKPEAKAFKRWITHDVLPTIRRTGSYSVAPTFQIPRSYAEALELAARQARELDANRDTIRELEPAAAAWDTLAEATGDYSVRETAQILDRDPGISTGQNRLFAHMREIGWLDTKGEPYQAQVDNGRLVRRTTSYTHPHTGEPRLASQVRVTAKGVEALRRDLTGGQLTVIDGGE